MLWLWTPPDPPPPLTPPHSPLTVCVPSYSCVRVCERLYIMFKGECNFWCTCVCVCVAAFLTLYLCRTILRHVRHGEEPPLLPSVSSSTAGLRPTGAVRPPAVANRCWTAAVTRTWLWLAELCKHTFLKKQRLDDSECIVPCFWCTVCIQNS